MTGPLRPAFYEGQVLAAADLAATVGYAPCGGRAARAVPARLGHRRRAGVGHGEPDRPGDERPVRRGERVAGAGGRRDGPRDRGRRRRSCCPRPTFEEVNGGRPAATRPVSGVPHRGRPDAAGHRCRRRAAPPPRRPGSRSPTRSSLDGWVTSGWSTTSSRRRSVRRRPIRRPGGWCCSATSGGPTGTSPPSTTVARGVGPRYAGVRADTVAARSDTLSLRTQPRSQEGKPALVLSGEDPPSLVFGLYQGSGSVSPLMTVAANGNLTIAGSFSGRISAGSVLATSGTATDGMLLPLPAGVAPEEVADGRVALHVYVTPRIPPRPTGRVPSPRRPLWTVSGGCGAGCGPSTPPRPSRGHRSSPARSTSWSWQRSRRRTAVADMTLFVIMCRNRPCRRRGERERRPAAGSRRARRCRAADAGPVGRDETAVRRCRPASWRCTRPTTSPACSPTRCIRGRPGRPDTATRAGAPGGVVGSAGVHRDTLLITVPVRGRGHHVLVLSRRTGQPPGPRQDGGRGGHG